MRAALTLGEVLHARVSAVSLETELLVLTSMNAGRTLHVIQTQIAQTQWAHSCANAGMDLPETERHALT